MKQGKGMAEAIADAKKLLQELVNLPEFHATKSCRAYKGQNNYVDGCRVGSGDGENSWVRIYFYTEEPIKKSLLEKKVKELLPNYPELQYDSVRIDPANTWHDQENDAVSVTFTAAHFSIPDTVQSVWEYKDAFEWVVKTAQDNADTRIVNLYHRAITYWLEEGNWPKEKPTSLMQVFPKQLESIRQATMKWAIDAMNRQVTRKELDVDSPLFVGITDKTLWGDGAYMYGDVGRKGTVQTVVACIQKAREDDTGTFADFVVGGLGDARNFDRFMDALKDSIGKKIWWTMGKEWLRKGEMIAYTTLKPNYVNANDRGYSKAEIDADKARAKPIQAELFTKCGVMDAPAWVKQMFYEIAIGKHRWLTASWTGGHTLDIYDGKGTFIPENAKVTLTIGQLKRLIKESYDTNFVKLSDFIDNNIDPRDVDSFSKFISFQYGVDPSKERQDCLWSIEDLKKWERAWRSKGRMMESMVDATLLTPELKKAIEKKVWWDWLCRNGEEDNQMTSSELYELTKLLKKHDVKVDEDKVMIGSREVAIIIRNWSSKRVNLTYRELRPKVKWLGIDLDLKPMKFD